MRLNCLTSQRASAVSPLWALSLLFLVHLLLVVPSNSTDIAPRKVVFDVDAYDHPLLINTTGLSITSVVFNPSMSHSPWVSRLLGETAVFHSRNGTSLRAPQAVSPAERRERSERFREAFQLPADAQTAACSLEIMGFFPSQLDKPFTLDDQWRRPIVGTATLSFPEIKQVTPLNAHLRRKMDWTCYYRASFENVSPQSQIYVHQYWPVFFYCPAVQHDQSCLALLHIYHQEFVGQLKDYFGELTSIPLAERNNRRNEVEPDLNKVFREQLVTPLDLFSEESGDPLHLRLRTFPFSKSQLDEQVAAMANRSQAIPTATLAKSAEMHDEPQVAPPLPEESPAEVTDQDNDDLTVQRKFRQRRQQMRRQSAGRQLHTSESLRRRLTYADVERIESERVTREQVFARERARVDNIIQELLLAETEPLSSLIEDRDLSSAKAPKRLAYQRYTDIQATVYNEYRDLYSAMPVQYPNAILAYLTALLTTNALSFARMNYPRPLTEFLVSPAIRSIVARLQRLALQAASQSQYNNTAISIFHTSRVLLPMSLTMNLKKSSYVTYFDLDLVNSEARTVERPLHRSNNLIQHEKLRKIRKQSASSSKASAKPVHKAVCTVIPYVAADKSKANVNGWMVYEFIRYYSKLGYVVVLYDREGGNLNSIDSFFSFDKAFTAAERAYYGHTDSEELNINLRYYDFTIFEILRLYPQNVVISHTEGALNKAIIRSDFDKRLTLTQCRQSVKQVYGIQEVLVVDFDEFLFCPQAASNAAAQSEFFNSYMSHLAHKGVEQFILKQRSLVSKENDMKQCMERQLERQLQLMAAVKEQWASSTNLEVDFSRLLSEERLQPIVTSDNRTLLVRPSLFNCVGSFDKGVKMFFDKCVHLNNACPSTSFHYASHLRHFDCLANTYTTTSKSRRIYAQYGCSIVHLSTKVNQYNRSHPFDMNVIRNTPVNELYSVNYDGP